MSAAAAVLAALASVHTNLGEVRACMPLDGGDVLVGTGGGLARLSASGEVRAVWTAVDGLPGTRVDGLRTVTPDAGGSELWVGTDGGAARIQLDGTALAVARTAGTGSVRDVIWFGGARYLATATGGLQKLRADGRGTAVAIRGAKPTAAQAPLRARVAALAVAGDTLFVATAGGLYRLRGGALELVPVETGANDIAALHADGDTLWIATNAGLFARTGDTVRAYGGGELRSVTRLDGAIVAAGLDGAVTVDRGRLVSLAGAPRSAFLQTIAAQGGAACAGGLDGLWLRGAASRAWTAVAPPAGPPANDISALAVAGDTLWVGTFDRGVGYYERGAWHAIADHDLDRRVNALLVDRRDGRIWVATAAGLATITRTGTTLRVATLGKRDGLPSRGVLSLAQLADGRILAGTLHGAAIIGDGRPVILAAKQALGITNVWAVAQDATGALWLGTTTGLYRGTVDDTGWTRFSVATGHLRDDWVMALAPKGTALWIGTYKGGVTRLDGTTATALGDGWINPGGLTWIGDTLHASTMEGHRTGDGSTAAWTTHRGAPGADVTAVARTGTTTWIATRRGLLARR